MTKRLNSLTDLAKDVQVGSTSKDNADVCCLFSLCLCHFFYKLANQFNTRFLA